MRLIATTLLMVVLAWPAGAGPYVYCNKAAKAADECVKRNIDVIFKFHPAIIALARWVYSNCSVKIYTEHELCYKASERVSLGLLRKDSDEFRRLTAIDSIIEKYIDRMLLSRRRSR
jgi:hypothetical protein